MEKIYYRTEKAITESSESELKELFQVFTNRISDSQKLINKLKNQLIIFLFTYLLIEELSIKSITLGPIEVDNLDLIIKLAPLVLAYKYYEFMESQIIRNILTESYYKIANKLYPSFSGEGLAPLLFETSATNIFLITQNIRPSKRLYNISLVLLSTLLLLFPLCSIGYSLYINYLKFGMKDILCWIVLIFTFLILYQIKLLFKLNNKSTLQVE